jgi:hypothetical protein
MPLDEDLTRYTAPPDNDPEEKRYSTAEILAYIESWIPSTDYYDINEIISVLNMAVAGIEDEDTGIDTI